MSVQIKSEAPPRAALRYFGGKWAIAPWVMQHLPDHRVYVEPFGGAASVLLRKPRSRIEVYNDLDEEIVSIFRVIQNPSLCQHLIKLLQRTPYSRREFEQAFLLTDDPVVRAKRAIVRAYQSFHHSSLMDVKKRSFADARHRTGNKSKAHEWASYPRTLAAVARRMKGVIVECRPALQVIRAQDGQDTLFFVDPPYVPETRTAAGYRHELSTDDHVELLDALKLVKGMVVIAGYPSDLYDQALIGWRRVERPHRAAGSTRSRTEVLWINPAAQAGLSLTN